MVMEDKNASAAEEGRTSSEGSGHGEPTRQGTELHRGLKPRHL